MLFGIDKYYECPKCGNLLSKRSLRSGNTFGSKFYSDGKQIAPMLPKFPSISKCSKCKTIFWLDKEVVNDGTRKVEGARFLSVDDYLSALKSKVYRSKTEEITIRQNILWKFNDRIRDDKPLFNSEEERLVWSENNEKLIDLLDPNDTNDKIFTVELLRYSGKFQKCEDILSTIYSPELNWILEAFKKEINNKNTSVFLLN